MDGFPWSYKYINGKTIKSKEAVKVQESTHDVLSTLLLEMYLEKFL